MSLKKRKMSIEEIGTPLHSPYMVRQRIEAIKLLKEIKKVENVAPIIIRQGEGEFARKLREKQEKQEKQG